MLIQRDKSILRDLATAHEQLINFYDKSGGPYKSIALKYMRTHYSRYAHDLASISSRLESRAHVLDLGAAPFLVPYALSLKGHDVVGFDYRPSDWIAAKLPFEVIQGDCDGQKLPFEDKSFDCVILTEVFEHLHVNLNFTMKEIRRILKDSGFLFLTTPNLLGVRGTLRLLRKGAMRDSIYDCWSGAENGGFLGHVREYTPTEIADHLRACGYSVVEVDTVNVYKKAKLETWFWSAVSAPFRNGKENIRAVARR